MRCSFCKQEIKKGTGMKYSTKGGSAYYFCSSKCRRNSVMGRRPPRERSEKK